MIEDTAVDSGLEDTFEIVLDLAAWELVVDLPYRDSFVVDLDTSDFVAAVVELAVDSLVVMAAEDMSEMGQKQAVEPEAEWPDQLSLAGLVVMVVWLVGLVVLVALLEEVLFVVVVVVVVVVKMVVVVEHQVLQLRQTNIFVSLM